MKNYTNVKSESFNAVHVINYYYLETHNSQCVLHRLDGPAIEITYSDKKESVFCKYYIDGIEYEKEHYLNNLIFMFSNEIYSILQETEDNELKKFLVTNTEHNNSNTICYCDGVYHNLCGPAYIDKNKTLYYIFGIQFTKEEYATFQYDLLHKYGIINTKDFQNIEQQTKNKETNNMNKVQSCKLSELNNSNETVKTGDLFKSYDGSYYEVIGKARHIDKNDTILIILANSLTLEKLYCTFDDLQQTINIPKFIKQN